MYEQRNRVLGLHGKVLEPGGGAGVEREREENGEGGSCSDGLSEKSLEAVPC